MEEGGRGEGEEEGRAEDDRSDALELAAACVFCQCTDLELVVVSWLRLCVGLVGAVHSLEDTAAGF